MTQLGQTRNAAPMRKLRLALDALEREDPWCLGNQVLYDLCREHPTHVAPEEIVAKIWLIGRAYAASIERGRSASDPAAVSNDEFYENRVVEEIRRSRLDRDLQGLDGLEDVTDRNAHQVIRVHADLVQVFRRLSGKSKRSLASKYLHFHRPNLFFIYDSRALLALDRLTCVLRIEPEPIRNASREDSVYAKFVAKAIGLRDFVREYDDRWRKLTPRQLDRLLLGSLR